MIDMLELCYYHSSKHSGSIVSSCVVLEEYFKPILVQEDVYSSLKSEKIGTIKTPVIDIFTVTVKYFLCLWLHKYYFINANNKQY